MNQNERDSQRLNEIKKRGIIWGRDQRDILDIAQRALEENKRLKEVRAKFVVTPDALPDVLDCGHGRLHTEE
jgi:hypothetical protein